MEMRLCTLPPLLPRSFDHAEKWHGGSYAFFVEQNPVAAVYYVLYLSGGSLAGLRVGVMHSSSIPRITQPRLA